MDVAECYFSANVGEELRPLARIASGGELSRVMLALKAIAVGADAPRRPSAGDTRKTLIFDEVDAGIGGRVADVVGSKLQELGGTFQVLCITHLPQIAARATTQFRIEKSVRGTRTVTTVEQLGDDARVEEIARMIGGAAVTAGVLASARELIGSARAASVRDSGPGAAGEEREARASGPGTAGAAAEQGAAARRRGRRSQTER